MPNTASPTNRYSCVITTVDPNAQTATGAPSPVIQGTIKSGKMIQVSLYNIPPAFRWPVVGETWMVIQYNGSWYLDGIFPLQSPAANNFTDYDQGDAVINSATGKLAIVGSGNTSTGVPDTDFELYYDSTHGAIAYVHDGATTYMTPSGVFTKTIGDGVSTSFTISHGLGTRAVIVSVRQADSPYAQVWTGLSATADTPGSVTVTFDTAPTIDEYVVAIISGAGPQGPVGPPGPPIEIATAPGTGIDNVQGLSGIGPISSNASAPTVVATTTLDIVNPSGSNVIVSGGVSGYTQATGGTLYQHFNVDGGPWTQCRWMWLNVADSHHWCGDWAQVVGPLTQGNHTFQLACSSANQTVMMDNNDQAFIMAREEYGIGAVGPIGPQGESGTDGSTTSIGTVPGAPTVGSHVLGSNYMDSNGAIYVCTVPGVPGTWQCPPGQCIAHAIYTSDSFGGIPASLTAWYITFVTPPSGSIEARFRCALTVPSTYVQLMWYNAKTNTSISTYPTVFDSRGSTGSQYPYVDTLISIDNLTPNTAYTIYPYIGGGGAITGSAGPDTPGGLVPPVHINIYSA